MYQNFQSHPVGLDGQNHILAQTPIKLLPASEFENRRKTRNDNVAEITAGLKQLTMQANVHPGIDESNPQSEVASTSAKTRPPKKTKRKPKYIIKW